MLKDFYLQDSLSDITFSVTHSGVTKSYQAHRVVLEAKSVVFKTMFETEMLEKTTGIIRFEDIDEKMFLLFLSYFYSEKVNMDTDVDAIKLAHLANQYEIPDLLLAIVSKLEDGWNSTKYELFKFCASDILKFYEPLHALLNSLGDFEKLTSNDLFSELPFHVVLMLLIANISGFQDHFVVFKAYSKWCKRYTSLEERRKVFKNFSPYILLSKMSNPNDVIKQVLPNNLYNQNHIMNFLCNNYCPTYEFRKVDTLLEDCDEY